MINLNSVLLNIYNKSPLQKKKIEGYLSDQPKSFFKEADKFIFDYSGYLKAEGLSFEYAVDAYLKMCRQMLKCQIFFMKHNRYPIDKQYKAFEEIYNSKKEMQSYMIGLALSQYLWITHYNIFSHLKEVLQQNKEKIKCYLEIGPGHGLFFKEAINTIGNDCKYTAIDISKVSLDLTKSIISFFQLDSSDIKFINNDMLNITSADLYDCIVMGEVLEHVENPKFLLDKLYTLLDTNGKAFVSTCVNCPTIDHVYHFKSVSDIRNILKQSNFKIVSEKILPVEKLPMDEIIKRKITINYSSIIKKGNN